MQQATRRRAMDLVQVDLFAKSRFLTGQEGLLDLGGLGRVKGADFSGLMALIRCKLEDVLLARREKKESTIKLAFNLPAADSLSWRHYIDHTLIAGSLVGDEFLLSRVVER